MERLEEIFPSRTLVSRDDVEKAPREQGAYLLDLRLHDPIAAMLARRAVVIDKGRYIYAGSARGPGGIRARLAHHFRHEKNPHWHVDQLTMAADEMSALVFRNEVECSLVARLAAMPQFVFPFPGFGSSDCPHCEAHLLRDIT